MQEDKKILLIEQIKKIDEVLAVLGSNFSEEVEDEINFLNVVSNNLKVLVK